MSRTSAKMAVLGAATSGLLVLLGSAAGAQAGGGSTFHFSQFSLTLPPISGPCSFLTGDSVNWTSGNGVGHDETNNNGDWGGGTITGSAQLLASDGSTVLDYGQATGWEGGGNNAGAQGEEGITVDFHGAVYSFHIDLHLTTNNAGTPTAGVDHAHC